MAEKDNWKTIKNVMTPGNLKKAGNLDISDIASCLGLEDEFQVNYMIDSG